MLLSQVVPERIRTSVYAFDKCVAGAIGALGAPLIGILAERVFGFKGVSISFTIDLLVLVGLAGSTRGADRGHSGGICAAAAFSTATGSAPSMAAGVDLHACLLKGHAEHMTHS